MTAPAELSVWRAALIDALRISWRLARRAVLATLQILAALILLFEEWGWRPLSDLLGTFARWRPIARLELWIAGLPPWAALVAFALPGALLLPVKIVGLWLLASGQVLLAALLLAAAKVASTALVARIFLLTKPALMQLRWFASAYGLLMPWKEAMFAAIRGSWAWRYGRVLAARALGAARRAWLRARPMLAAAWTTVRTRLSDAVLTARIMARRLRWRMRARGRA